MKLPRAAGMAGMMTRNTMIAPWRVKARLYISADMMVVLGVSSSSRISKASSPPMIMKATTDQKYIKPMRLWSTVVSQFQRPLFSER